MRLYGLKNEDYAEMSKILAYEIDKKITEELENKLYSLSNSDNIDYFKNSGISNLNNYSIKKILEN